MRRVALVVVLLLSMTPGVMAADPSCGLQTVTDPEGDTTIPGGISGFDSRPADILHVAMERNESVGVRMSVTLAGDPRQSGSGAMTYSYWVGFEDGGLSSGGNPPTWTFQGSRTYDRISTMYWDAPEWYEVEWNGTTMSFLIPWQDFEGHYGDEWPIPIGSPHASSSGPSAAGLNNPSQDSARYTFDRDPVPLDACPQPLAAQGTPPVPAAQEAPTAGVGGATVVLLSLALFASARRAAR